MGLLTSWITSMTKPTVPSNRSACRLRRLGVVFHEALHRGDRLGGAANPGAQGPGARPAPAAWPDSELQAVQKSDLRWP